MAGLKEDWSSADPRPGEHVVQQYKRHKRQNQRKIIRLGNRRSVWFFVKIPSFYFRYPEITREENSVLYLL
jgi:hypothetical protein